MTSRQRPPRLGRLRLKAGAEFGLQRGTGGETAQHFWFSNLLVPSAINPPRHSPSPRRKNLPYTPGLACGHLSFPCIFSFPPVFTRVAPPVTSAAYYYCCCSLAHCWLATSSPSPNAAVAPLTPRRDGHVPSARSSAFLVIRRRSAPPAPSLHHHYHHCTPQLQRES